MHLSDFSVGSLGETSIVGSGLPVAVGAALGSSIQGNDRVTLCFFGDGASNTGAFHESCNLAAIWSLPVIFVCENNGYAVSTTAASSSSVKDLAQRGSAYNMASEIVDGQDVEKVYEVTRRAVAQARNGKGPTLIESKTYRYAEHAVNMGRVLRDRGTEVDEWRRRDPLEMYRKRLQAVGFAEDALERMAAEVRSEVAAAIAWARSAAPPEIETAFEDVFSFPLAVPEFIQATREVRS
jgi:pyruvate dehydrogenase E1 component alpha subunit